MTSDDYDIPPDDFDDLIAQSETEWPAEPSMPAAVLSIPLIKSILRDKVRTLMPVRDELRDFDRRSKTALSPMACQVLAAITARLRFPIDEVDHPAYVYRLEQAQTRQSDRFVPDAFEEVDSLIDIIDKALHSLHMLDLFDQRLPDSWSNLPYPALARSINAYAFAVFGGAIVRI